VRRSNPGIKVGLKQLSSGNTGKLWLGVVGPRFLDLRYDPESCQTILRRNPRVLFYGSLLVRVVILTPAVKKTIEYSRTLAEEMNLNEGILLCSISYANPIITFPHYKTTGLNLRMIPKGKSTSFCLGAWGLQVQSWGSRILKKWNPIFKSWVHNLPMGQVFLDS